MEIKIPTVNIKTVASILLLCVVFVFGIWIGRTYWPKEIEVEKTVVIHDGAINENSIHVEGEAESTTSTTVAYVPKEYVTYQTQDEYGNDTWETELENTDVDMDIGKQELIVSVNGQEVQIEKEDNEKYVFDKNKLKIDQESVARFNVYVDPVEVDNTKHWGVGIGVNNKGKPAGMVTVPIDKKHNIDAWGYYDGDRTAGGIMARF